MCSDCDLDGFLDEIEAMLDDPDFEWAEDTILGIRDTVKFKHHVTQRQAEAIENIKNSVEERRE